MSTRTLDPRALPVHPSYFRLRLREPHVKRCRLCLERLTSRSSILRGYGPSCWLRLTGELVAGTRAG